MTFRNRVLARSRRAFREVAFIVVGVLIALGADSWWSNRRDMRLGEAYLVQLLAEAEENESILRTAIAEDSTRAYAARGLFEGLHARTRVPADSIRTWMKADPLWYSDPRLLMGAANTLIETGDIGLIADTGVRRAIVAYLSLMASDLEELQVHVDLSLTAGIQLRAAGEVHRIYPFNRLSFAPGTFDPEEIELLIQAWPRFEADVEARAASGTLLIAKGNRLFYLRRMHAETEKLIAIVRGAT